MTLTAAREWTSQRDLVTRWYGGHILLCHPLMAVVPVTVAVASCGTGTQETFAR